jgi:uracil-DNA glycosylase
MPNLRAILALGKIAHDSVCDALVVSKSKHIFKHGARYEIEEKARDRTITLVASYHCSRYNTNTGVLTEKMFDEAVALAKSAAIES